MNLHLSVRLLLIILTTTPLFAQKEYPKSDFIPPLDVPLFLAGNFGELRSNHFHAGIDIKTQQREGLKVYSVADGYVSRIKVSHYGYGKALYVTHPNGYTTVYGHLQKFSKEIQDYVVQMQYEKESYEIELFPGKNKLPLHQGDVIAFSGNTGGSGGPHLHFEVRDTETEHIINPILFGIDIKDSSAPVMDNIIAYSLGADAQINGTQGTYQLKYHHQSNGTVSTSPIKASGYIAFGINSYDRQDGSYNHNGVYAMQVLVNNDKYLDLDFETFSFDESREINTYIDYPKFATSSRRYQKTFIDAGNNLSIYNYHLNQGKILIEPGKNYTVTILLKDVENNTTTIKIPVTGEQLPVTNPYNIAKTDYYVIANREAHYELDDVSVYFPANTFYDNLYLDIKKEANAIYIHNKEVALNNYYNLTFDVSNFKDSLNLSKYFIANYNYKGYPIYETTKLKGSKMSTRTRDLGKFGLLKDDTPPTVKAQNFKNNQWISNYNYLIFTISDDLSGLNSYKATIDGKYILTEYEYKKHTLTFNCNDMSFEGSKHILELVVTDNVGNSTTFTSTFFRKY